MIRLFLTLRLNQQLFHIHVCSFKVALLTLSDEEAPPSGENI
jgi:hypothetical protein